MQNQPEETNVKKRCYAVIVESLQNISHHSEFRNGLPEGIIILGKKDRQCIVAAGNILNNERIEPLKNHIEKINKLDKAGLEEMYRTVLSGKRIKTSDGSGVGLIDIARKSGGKLVYDFVPVNDKTSFLTLIVKIPA